jgi:hypothetical protein
MVGVVVVRVGDAAEGLMDRAIEVAKRSFVEEVGADGAVPGVEVLHACEPRDDLEDAGDRA